MPKLANVGFWSLCMFCFSGALSSAREVSEKFLGVEVEWIERVIDLGYNLDARAETEILAMAQKHPESPVPSLLRSGRLYWLQNYAEWDAALTKRFEESVEESLDEAKAFLKQRRKDPDAAFVVAMNELLQVIHAVDEHRWWAAFWKTRSSLKTMKRLLEDDPDYHDAKMPLGMAHCYMSHTPGYLKPLSFLMRFKGDMELGLEYMQDAKTHGLFTKVDAAYHLGAIRVELEANREGAREEFAALVEAYPDNVMFQTLLAEFDRSLDRLEAARDRAAAVLDQPKTKAFPAVEARALKSLMWSALGTGDFRLTIEAADRFAALGELYEELQDQLDWATHARAEALNGLGQVEAAIALWESLTKGNSEASDVASERLAEVRTDTAAKAM